MSRYCASCGKLLADDAKFCTSCGAPVEQTTGSNGQPAFEKTGSLDTPQAKPDDPAAGPAAVETTQRILFAPLEESLCLLGEGLGERGVAVLARNEL